MSLATWSRGSVVAVSYIILLLRRLLYLLDIEAWLWQECRWCHGAEYLGGIEEVQKIAAIDAFVMCLLDVRVVV